MVCICVGAGGVVLERRTEGGGRRQAHDERSHWMTYGLIPAPFGFFRLVLHRQLHVRLGGAPLPEPRIQAGTLMKEIELCIRARKVQRRRHEREQPGEELLLLLEALQRGRHCGYRDGDHSTTRHMA